MPVGIVPGGSGNALNCSLLSQLHQPLDGVNNLGAKAAGVNVAEGAALDQTVPLDLLEIEAGGRKLISFFGINIGLIADVDIGKMAILFVILLCHQIINFHLLTILQGMSDQRSPFGHKITGRSQHRNSLSNQHKL